MTFPMRSHRVRAASFPFGKLYDQSLVMGEFRFTLPPNYQPSPSAVKWAYVSGMDGVPWRSRNSVQENELVVERDVKDSGQTHLVWSVDDDPPVTLCTANLMERSEPYDLAIEIARGTLNRLRNQLASWRLAKLTVSDEIVAQIDSACGLFFDAVVHVADSDYASAKAFEAIRRALAAMQSLADTYTEQVLEIRHASNPRLSTLLGCNLGLEELPETVSAELGTCLTAASAPLTWSTVESSDGDRQWDATDRAIEYCRAKRLPIFAGPIIDLSSAALPSFVYLWDDEDFDELLSQVVSYARDCVQRYTKLVSVWHATSGTNVSGPLKLAEEKRLRLTVAVVETIRELDPKTPVIVSFDQPWGEYLAQTPSELSPLHFADALVRADLGIAGLGLNFNLGWGAKGTFSRDVLQWSQQLDRWSMLGLPLIPFISIGSEPSVETDASMTGDRNPEVQASEAAKIFEMLITKQPVQGVFWNQLADSDKSPLPGGGLFDANFAPKPILEVLRQIRQKHL